MLLGLAEDCCVRPHAPRGLAQAPVLRCHKKAVARAASCRRMGAGIEVCLAALSGALCRMACLRSSGLRRGSGWRQARLAEEWRKLEEHRRTLAAGGGSDAGGSSPSAAQGAGPGVRLQSPILKGVLGSSSAASTAVGKLAGSPS